MASEKIEHPTVLKPFLIVFDVEGVLIPKRRYLLFEASRLLSLGKFLKMLFAGFFYEVGLMPIETAIKTVVRQFRGIALDELYRLYKKIPVNPSVSEVFEKLKEKGCKIALISSGIPKQFVEDLASQLGADYAVGFELTMTNGNLTGGVSGDVIKAGGKALALKKIVEKEGLTSTDCALVADDRNNFPMFQFCALRVGYNPDFLLSAKSDVVVKGDFSDILPLLIGEQYKLPKSRSFSRREIIRSTIHIGGFLVPIVSLYLLSRYVIAFLIFLVTLLYIISELARMRGFNLPIISTITLNAAVKSEMHEFITAPIFYAMGIIIALILFSEPVGYASIATLTLGDGFAEIVGAKKGRHVLPYNRGKSIEGSAFGFVIAFIGASLFVSPLKALLGATIGMFVESLPTPVNDNLAIPIVSGFFMSLIP